MLRNIAPHVLVIQNYKHSFLKQVLVVLSLSFHKTRPRSSEPRGQVALFRLGQCAWPFVWCPAPVRKGAQRWCSMQLDARSRSNGSPDPHSPSTCAGPRCCQWWLWRQQHPERHAAARAAGCLPESWPLAGGTVGALGREPRRRSIGLNTAGGPTMCRWSSLHERA